MKKYILSAKLLTLLLLLLAFSAKAQTQTEPDARLYEVFERSDIDNWKQNNPELIAWYNHFLSNSFFVVELNKLEKPASGEDIKNVKYNSGVRGQGDSFDEQGPFNPGTFNVLKYAFELNPQKAVTYVWEEEGIALVFYSQQQIQRTYQKNNEK